MNDHDENVRRLARYGSAAARAYLMVWICICYFWLIIGLIAGVLIINDGSTVFGAGVIAVGLIAGKIAGHLRRLRNGDT